MQVRRDGKDNVAVAKVIRKEFLHRMDIMEQSEFISHMHTYASACWVCMFSILFILHQWVLGYHGIGSPAVPRG
jgi:hypothetical protein